MKTIHKEEYSSLIHILSQERKRLGLSQKEVAEAVGMTQSDISKVESLERRLDIIEFKNFVQAFRINKNTKLREEILEFLDLGLEKHDS